MISKANKNLSDVCVWPVPASRNWSDAHHYLICSHARLGPGAELRTLKVSNT